jgi:hypothetical protein
MRSGIEIDYETADRITLATLKEQLSFMETNVANAINGTSYMHPEDLAQAQSHYIPAFTLLIEYFGG